MQFQIDNMTCGGCARKVTMAVQALDPDARVVADPSSRQIRVESAVAEEQIAAALCAAGYPPSLQ